ncbi:lipoprotein [Treponema primitia]|uniref:lipoprotein n=1 Tax=Treponema primitia TaxID=88058 RepID=UPI0002554D8D|nr:lipoprotein [Treponema primitia]
MKKTMLVCSLVIGLLAVSCDFLIGPDTPVGKGNVTILVGDGSFRSGRAALPSSLTDQFRYEFTLTGAGQTIEKTIAPGVSSISLLVSLGEWNIATKAYTADGLLAGEGNETVTVSAGSKSVSIVMAVKDSFISKAITAFAITSPVEIPGIVDEAAKTVLVTAPYGTDITGMVTAITHTGVSISPAAGTPQDFTNPVIYSVTAGDGTIQPYTVTVLLGTESDTDPDTDPDTSDPGTDDPDTGYPTIDPDAPFGIGLIAITFTGPADETITLTGITDGATLSWLTDTLSLSVDTNDFPGALYQWYQDGRLISEAATYSVAGSEFTLGEHQVMLQITLPTQVAYSKVLTFSVD